MQIHWTKAVSSRTRSEHPRLGTQLDVPVRTLEARSRDVTITHRWRSQGFRCRRVKDLTSPTYVSFYSSPATKCPSVCNIPWYESLAPKKEEKLSALQYHFPRRVRANSLKLSATSTVSWNNQNFRPKTTIFHITGQWKYWEKGACVFYSSSQVGVNHVKVQLSFIQNIFLKKSKSGIASSLRASAYWQDRPQDKEVYVLWKTAAKTPASCTPKSRERNL